MIKKILIKNGKILTDKEGRVLSTSTASDSGGSSEEYPSEAIAYYKQTRNKDYPYFPLPYEMEETETQDTIYMLYDANGYMCCPAFNITFTDCTCTVQKYNNTKLVSESVVNDIVSGTTYYMQFSEEDSDWNTYNYIVIKLQGSITKHHLNFLQKFNNVEYPNYIGGELLEVSGKCNSCDIKVVNTTSYSYHKNLEYYSFVGVSNTNMSYTFYNCTFLKAIVQLETKNATDMSYMIRQCPNLRIVAQLETSNVTNMDCICYSCNALETISFTETSKVNKLTSAFSSCYSLQTTPEINCGSIPYTSYMNYIFDGCYKLQNVNIFNIKGDFGLSSSIRLSATELVKILNNLVTVTSTRTLTLGSINLAKLTDEEKAIATNKGWTLA